MFTFNKRQRIDQQKRPDYARTTHAPDFFNLPTAPALYDTVESLLSRHRERLFAPTETLSLFLAQDLSWDRSCQMRSSKPRFNA
jgi:hypothetical protein